MSTSVRIDREVRLKAYRQAITKNGNEIVLKEDEDFDSIFDRAVKASELPETEVTDSRKRSFLQSLIEDLEDVEFDSSIVEDNGKEITLGEYFSKKDIKRQKKSETIQELIKTGVLKKHVKFPIPSEDRRRTRGVQAIDLLSEFL
jgi:hypothetical protein